MPITINNYKRMLDLIAKAKHSVSDLCSLPDFEAIDTALDELSGHIEQLKEQVKHKRKQAEEEKRGGPDDR